MKKICFAHLEGVKWPLFILYLKDLSKRIILFTVPQLFTMLAPGDNRGQVKFHSGTITMS